MMDAYRQFFQQLTGFTPNPFQERVAAALLDERSVVLRAPTGSGKTWAIVAPFLYALQNGQPIADRLLYALPLRSLATSLYQSTSEKVQACVSTQPLSDRIRIQTGEQRDDPLFEGRVTFTTIDQLLSSYLMQPVGLPSRVGNISAGALLGSLVCFDEFHLLEPGKSMGTAIEMLENLAVAHPLCRFVLMTATLSDETLSWLTRELNAKLIDVPAAEVKELPNEIGKTRYYRWIEEPLTAAAVARVHDGKCSIVIANTVTRAQELYDELNQLVLETGTQIRLLHSRFLARDRQQIESCLADWFGPQAPPRDVILVATQVIEAGMDLSCDNLHTKVAPMNAIVQRAGRCARRQNQIGTVHCYALGVNRQGKTSYGAYIDVSTLVDETSAALREVAAEQPKQFVFHDELAVVNRVHKAWELQQLRPFENLGERRKAVRAAMDGDNREAVRELVRDVASINVVITDQLESLNFNRREWPEMLSVPPSSLYRLFSEGLPPVTDWIAKAAREAEVMEGGAIEVKWEPLNHAGDLQRAGWLIAIHPSRATYDAEHGLVIGRAGKAEPVQTRVRQQVVRYSYKKETYAEHIRRVRAAGAKRDADHAVAAARLAEVLNITPTQLARWVDLLYRLHDIGKLSVGWQQAVWTWQAEKESPVAEPRPPLAHTDYDPSIDQGKRIPKRPPHAAEGAYAATHLLMQAFESQTDPACVLAAVSAIVRHHGTFTAGLSDFRLIPQARQSVAETLEWEPEAVTLCDLPDSVTQEEFGDEILTATTEEYAAAWPLYLYFVRRLRIADQNSFQEQ